MSFLTSLSWEDLQGLRAIVRRMHAGRLPERHLKNDHEIDRIIEAIGPIAMEDTKREQIERNLESARFYKDMRE